MEKAEKKLSKEVAEKYQVLEGHGVGEYYTHAHGHVHLDKINVEQAEELVKTGFPYLVELKQASKPKANAA
jgi:hypothetical protein